MPTIAPERRPPSADATAAAAGVGCAGGDGEGDALGGAASVTATAPGGRVSLARGTVAPAAAAAGDAINSCSSCPTDAVVKRS